MPVPKLSLAKDGSIGAEWRYLPPPPFLERESSESAETQYSLVGERILLDWETFGDVEGDEEETYVQLMCSGRTGPSRFVEEKEDGDGNKVYEESKSNTTSIPSRRFRKGGYLRQNLEVLPGLVFPLRDYQETLEAIVFDFLTCAPCSCCNDTLYCIRDVYYVVCPDCFVVSPANNIGQHEYSYPWFAGLGMKEKDLAESRELLRQADTDDAAGEDCNEEGGQ